MNRRVWQWAAGIIASVLLVCVAAAFWLVATEGGTRWLVARVTPLLPTPLQIAQVDGTLLRGVHFRSVSWTDRTVTVSVDELDTRIALLPLLRREVRINSLDVRNVDVFVSERPSADGDSAPFSLDLPITILIEAASITSAHVTIGAGDITIEHIWLSGRLSGSALRIDRLDVQSDMGDISLAGDGRLAGPYPATAEAAWELRLQDQPPMSGMIRVQGDMSRYAIEHDLIEPYEITTVGALAFIDHEFVGDLTHTWQVVNLEASDGRTVEMTGGVLRMIGTANAFSFDGSATISSGDIPELAVATRGKREGDRIDFESVSITNDWGQLLAAGGLLVSPELAWDFAYEISDLNPALADQRLSGDLQITGKSAGRIANQQPLLDVWIDSLAGNLNGHPVNGSGILSYANERLQFDKAVVRIGDNRIDFDGSYGPRLRVNAALRLSDLGQLGIGAAGALNGDIRLASDLKTFEASGKLNGVSLQWNDYFAATLSAEFDVPTSGQGSAVLQVADARAGKFMFQAGRLSAFGSTQSHRLQAEIVADQGRAELELDGRFAGETWSGAIEKLAVGGEQLGVWTLRDAADFSLTRSQVEVAKTCLTTASSKGVACGMIDYDFSGPLRFDAAVIDLPLAVFLVNLPEGASVEGTIEAKASGEFENQQLNATANFKLNSLQLKAIFEGDEVAVSFDRAFARTSIVDNRLAGELEFRLSNDVDHLSSTIEVADVFDQGSPLRGHASLELNDLGVFSFFFPDVSNPAGRVAGSVDVDGTLLAPEIIGEIGLANGSFGIRRAGVSITDVDVLIRQVEAGQLALHGSARSGEGILKLVGKTTLSSSSGMRTELSLDGENFTLVQLPDWQVTASPAIAVLFDDRETRVSGQLDIPKANINIFEVPETAEQPSPDAVVYRENEPIKARQRILHVDVRTSLGKEVFLSGFGLTTGLEGSVRIAGSSTTPYVSSGRVVLRDGRYEAYGQNLKIESGELIFNGPLTDPTLNIRATRTASDKTVAGIHLTGTPTQLKSQVYSEPALGDAEALSYLLTGRPLAKADSAEGDMLNQAAFALGLTTAGNIASRIRNEFGFETLGIQGGSENRQLVAGKRIGDRLLVEYAYGLIDNLGTLLLRYQLSSRLVLESRSGLVRNVDIVYSVKKK